MGLHKFIALWKVRSKCNLYRIWMPPEMTPKRFQWKSIVDDRRACSHVLHSAAVEPQPIKWTANKTHVGIVLGALLEPDGEEI